MATLVQRQIDLASRIAAEFKSRPKGASVPITRAQLSALAGAGGLLAERVYLITDEGRLAVGLTASTFEVFAKFGEAGGGTAAPTMTPVIATGTGAAQNITLPVSGLAPRDVYVFVNGVRWPTSEYTITGATLTLTTNQAGDAVEIVRPTGAQGPQGEPGAPGAPGSGGGSAPDFPFFDGRYAGWYGADSSFQTVPLNQVAADTHGGWNSSTNTWTVPAGQSGIYQVFGKYRIVDGGPQGQSIGIGLDTSNTDSPTFFWGVTNPNRQGISNQRFAQFNAGDQIRLFSYIDGGSRNIEAAALNILRVK